MKCVIHPLVCICKCGGFWVSDKFMRCPFCDGADFEVYPICDGTPVWWLRKYRIIRRCSNMLEENELKMLIEAEEDRHQYILDVKAQECHKHYLLGLKCVLNE